MTKKTTIYDIAEKLNISSATVSRALNGPDKVSKSTYDLVNKTAQEMGYRGNIFAKALKSGKSYNVGVIVPWIDTDFFGSAIRGIQEALNPKGYHVIICQTYDKAHLEVETINSLLKIQVDGIFMSISNSKTDNTEVFSDLANKNIPFVFFDRKKNIKGVSSVTVDDFKGGYLATTHLIEQGCKHIAHFTNNHQLEIFKNRYLGYKQALEDHGIKFDPELVINAPYTVEDGRKTTKKILKSKTPPDAIFAAHDFLALGAIQEIKAQGLKVPDDICVVGFSNEPFSKFMELSITSVNQSPLELGKISAQIFLDEISSSEKMKSEKHVVLTPELIKRKSSMRINREVER